MGLGTHRKTVRNNRLDEDDLLKEEEENRQEDASFRAEMERLDQYYFSNEYMDFLFRSEDLHSWDQEIEEVPPPIRFLRGIRRGNTNSRVVSL
jgi:hypothetical protein